MISFSGKDYLGMQRYIFSFIIISKTGQVWNNRPIRKSPYLSYHLYSRNPPHPTIEEELLKAFRASGAIDPDWFDRPQQAYFQRASRTDKGVSAIKMIISLRIGR